MFENIEKALTIMLLAIGVKLNGEDEQVKKRKTSSVWMKAWFQTVYVQLHTEIYFRNYTWKIKKNTNLTKNIVMAAPVTMNSTLGNAGVQDTFI